MKNLIELTIAVSVMVLTGSAFAAGECDKYTTSYDMTYCYSKLFVESDKELNTIYKDLKGKLNAGMKERLTSTQKAWIKYRGNACESTPGSIDVNCNYQVNKARTEYLRDRLRECKTGNCREEMIEKKGWQ